MQLEAIQLGLKGPCGGRWGNPCFKLILDWGGGWRVHGWTKWRWWHARFLTQVGSYWYAQQCMLRILLISSRWKLIFWWCSSWIFIILVSFLHNLRIFVRLVPFSLLEIPQQPGIVHWKVFSWTLITINPFWHNLRFLKHVSGILEYLLNQIE